jgi:hypothetical protein
MTFQVNPYDRQVDRSGFACQRYKSDGEQDERAVREDEEPGNVEGSAVAFTGLSSVRRRLR